ncbi:N-carbamoylputrescine amidase [Acidisoma sp.]|uniref:N-carbamoylputrescine amidase n=1 Tax=Acidisoma sp. TaxID=1872115 RepID=UPI003B002F19
MREVTVAATQMSASWELPANLDRAERLVREAHGRGARLIVLSQLFAAPYFCQDQLVSFFDLAAPFQNHPLLSRFADLARELGVVLPVSFFERSGPAFYSSVVVIDADGAMLGTYRKSHIPDEPGFSEKFYFSPGDSGFRAWDTAVGRIGVGIGWDQWFPETARIMALKGAEILLYPSTIGCAPDEAAADQIAHWRRVMQGHAAANIMPVIAANRIGVEEGRQGTSKSFWGSSFITGPTGEILAEADLVTEAVLTATFDLDAIARLRAGWGLFRDRRPDLYRSLLTLDGRE